MGNCITNKISVQIRRMTKTATENESMTMIQNKKPKISQCNLLRVLDFLKFQELKEAGKVNQ